MNPSVLVPGIVGAICGALGWLLVGLYMSNRQNARVAMNAGRAVYFELEMNRLSVAVALEYDSFAPLGRTSFDRLLPELATWLDPEALQTIVAAYMSHVGYAQIGEDRDLPSDIRKHALSGILGTQTRALDLLRRRVFSDDDARRMERAAQDATSGALGPAQGDPAREGA